MILAAVVAVAVGGPLFVTTLISFLMSFTLLILFSPLLLVFGPLLLLLSLVVIAAFAGLGAAGVMAVEGVWTIAWSLRKVLHENEKKNNDDENGRVIEVE